MENNNYIFKNQDAGNNQPKNSENQNPIHLDDSNLTLPNKDNKKLTAITAVIASVIIVAAVVVCLFALNGKPKQVVDAKYGVSTTAAEKTTAEKSEPTTFPEPEGGWAKTDISKLAENIVIGGYKISLPCTVGEFKAQGWKCDYHVPAKNTTSFYMVFSKGDVVFMVRLNTSEYYDKNLDDIIINNVYADPIKMEYYNDLGIDWNFDWITKNVTLDELENKYGILEPVLLTPGAAADFYRLYDSNQSDSSLIIGFHHNGGGLSCIVIEVKE